MIFTAICRYLYITIESVGLGYLSPSPSLSLSLIVILSRSVTYPPHATKTIEQTVIGQFEFMYTRRSHERFVGPSRLGLPQNTCTFTCTCVSPTCTCNNTSRSFTAPTPTHLQLYLNLYLCIHSVPLLLCSVLLVSPWPTVSNVACYGPQMLLSKAYP